MSRVMDRNVSLSSLLLYRVLLLHIIVVLFAKWDEEEDFQHIRIKIQLQRDICQITWS